jgi:hypothetical protein
MANCLCQLCGQGSDHKSERQRDLDNPESQSFHLSTRHLSCKLRQRVPGAAATRSFSRCSDAFATSGELWSLEIRSARNSAGL